MVGNTLKYRGLLEGQTISNYHLWLLHELELCASADEFDTLKDAPTEWIEACYPYIGEYGGNIQYVLALMKDWSNISDERVNLFQGRVSTNLFGVVLTPKHMKMLERLNRVRAEMGYKYLTEEVTHHKLHHDSVFMLYTDYVIAALQALTVRDAIKRPELYFGQKDYDELTEFVRKNWGKIHPDDVDIYNPIPVRKKI